MAVCFCAVACSLVGMMLPESQMGRVYKLLTSLVFLSCLISPVMSLGAQPISFQLDMSAQNTQEIGRQAEEVAQKLAFDSSQGKIRQIVDYNLQRLGISAEKIEVTIHNEESDNIFFIEADITLDGAFQKREEEIMDFLKKELDIDCTLHWNEGDMKDE